MSFESYNDLSNVKAALKTDTIALRIVERCTAVEEALVDISYEAQSMTIGTAFSWVQEELTAALECQMTVLFHPSTTLESLVSLDWLTGLISYSGGAVIGSDGSNTFGSITFQVTSPSGIAVQYF